jgi:hypothetical protein
MLDTRQEGMSFTFLTNRNLPVFKAALEPLGACVWQSGTAPQVDLLYFDRYGGQQPPAGLQASCELMDRARTIPLDHKLQLARTMTANALDFPRHCFSPDELPPGAATLWYVKDPLSAGSERLWLCRRDEVADFFEPGFIIQEALTDLALYQGRKFTLRSYVLVYAGSVYWYPDSFLVVHGAAYDPALPDAEAHFSHIGYMQPGSSIRLVASQDYRDYHRIEAPLVELVQDVFRLYEAQLGLSNPRGHFCLFGLDLLQLADGRVALVEINDRPNLHHTDEINQRINQPMLQAMSRLLLGDKVSFTPAKPFEELMFYEC